MVLPPVNGCNECFRDRASTFPRHKQNKTHYLVKHEQPESKHLYLPPLPVRQRSLSELSSQEILKKQKKHCHTSRNDPKINFIRKTSGTTIDCSLNNKVDLETMSRKIYLAKNYFRKWNKTSQIKCNDTVEIDEMIEEKDETDDLTDVSTLTLKATSSPEFEQIFSQMKVGFHEY